MVIQRKGWRRKGGRSVNKMSERRQQKRRGCQKKRGRRQRRGALDELADSKHTMRQREGDDKNMRRGIVQMRKVRKGVISVFY